ncbi:MAG TPA: hypothetical protein VG488_11730 [Candidatus Angelobacter sp.]|jgi:hypothetical protein|nr:hypothetical protein [Candidatus Angelobacter sp.]
MNFSELIGEQVFVHSPIFKAGQNCIVKIVGVEAGGIWVESEVLSKTLNDTVKVTVEEGTLQSDAVFFLPFHAIGFAMKLRGVSVTPK